VDGLHANRGHQLLGIFAKGTVATNHRKRINNILIEISLSSKPLIVWTLNKKEKQNTKIKKQKCEYLRDCHGTKETIYSDNKCLLSIFNALKKLQAIGTEILQSP
jgi:hypothetical protein